MRELNRLLAWLTPGAKWLLALWVIGGVLRCVPGLGQWLPLVARTVWHGQVWRLISYTFVPNGPIDFIINALAFAILSTSLERRWSCRTLMAYGGFVVLATGMTMAAVQPASPVPWRGAGPLLFGLLAAWGRICGHEKVGLAPSLELTGMALVMIFGIVSLLVTVFTSGWMNALFAGLWAAWGLVYLWARTKFGEATARPIAVSRRINRLEL